MLCSSGKLLILKAQSRPLFEPKDSSLDEVYQSPWDLATTDGDAWTKVFAPGSWILSLT